MIMGLGICLTAMAVTGLGGRAPVAEPFRAKMDFREPVLAITVSVGAKLEARFYLNTSRMPSRISPSIAAKVAPKRDGKNRSLTCPLLMGGRSLGDVKFDVEESAKGVTGDGSLGLDVLRHYAIGFDCANGEVLFWRGGLTAKEARAWIADLPAFGDCKPGFGSSAMETDSKGLPYLTVNASKSTLKAQLGTSSPMTRIALSALTALDVNFDPKQGDSYERLEDGTPGLVPASIGPLTEAPLAVYLEKPYRPQGGLKAERGVVSYRDVASRRIVIDMPSKTFYGETLPRDQAAVLRYSLYVGFPLCLKGGALFVWASADCDPVFDPYLDKPVLAVAGIDATDVVKALLAGGDATFKLYEATSKAHSSGDLVVRVLMDEHNHTDVTIK